MHPHSLRVVSRRRVLALIGLAVPAAACGVESIEDAQPPRDPTPTGRDLDVATRWDALAAKLEGAGPIYNAANPGPWAGKEPKHVPTLTLSGKNVVVEVPHEMKPSDGGLGEHYITTIYVRDEQGEIVFLAEYKVTDPAAKAVFPLPEGATAATLTAYAHCNLHGLWSSRTLAAIPSDAGAPDPAWATRARELEAAGVYSATEEGPWPGKAPKHVPIVEAAKGVVQVSVPHEMRPASTPDAGAPGDAGALPAHYVGTIYIKNQEGIVIGLKELQATSPLPVALFSLPPGTTSVTAFAWCNLHGTWRAVPTPTTT